MFDTGYALPGVSKQYNHAASTQRGLLQMLTPVAIDCAGADGRAEGAGSAEPGLSADQGSVETSVEQVAVPSAFPLSSARDKEAVRYRVYKKRQLNWEPFFNRGRILSSLCSCRRRDPSLISA